MTIWPFLLLLEVFSVQLIITDVSVLVVLHHDLYSSGTETLHESLLAFILITAWLAVQGKVTVFISGMAL